MVRHPVGPRTHWRLQFNLSLLHGTVSRLSAVMTNCLGAESLLHVTVVHVSFLLCFPVRDPASWRDEGPRMSDTPVSHHTTCHITGFTVNSLLWPVPVVYVAPHGGAASLPHLQGPPLHSCICMCPPVSRLASLFLGFEPPYFRQTLFQHRDADISHWPMGQ